MQQHNLHLVVCVNQARHIFPMLVLGGHSFNYRPKQEIEAKLGDVAPLLQDYSIWKCHMCRVNPSYLGHLGIQCVTKKNIVNFSSACLDLVGHTCLIGTAEYWNRSKFVKHVDIPSR